MQHLIPDIRNQRLGIWMDRAATALQTLATRKLTIEFDKLQFPFERLSARRLRTWLLAELGCALRTPRVLALPTHLQIEPSSICNLRCPLCHVVTDNKPRGLLTLPDFIQIIDEVGDDILFLHFWGWGEPFMNPDIYAMIHYAKARGIQILSSTNGHFFDSDDNVDRLIDSGLDALIFALDGINAETYERYRCRGDFERALRNLRHLLQRRAGRGKTHPFVNLRMLVSRHNEDQVPGMRDLARKLGVDALTLKTLCAFDKEEQWREMLPHNPAYNRFCFDQAGKIIRIDNPCKKLWNHPTIYRDGSVVLCDYHTGEELTVGNALTDPDGFAGVWFGEAFRTLRKRFLKGDRGDLRCDSCSLNYADVDLCVSHIFCHQEP